MTLFLITKKQLAQLKEVLIVVVNPYVSRLPV